MNQLPMESTEPRGISLTDIWSALPSFGISGLFLVTWFAPYTFGEKMVSNLLVVMLVEFINVHASAVLGHAIVGKGDRRWAALAIGGVSLFYLLFIAGIAAATKQWWPVWTFLGLTLNRLLGLLLGRAPTGEEKRMVQYSWAAGVFFYVLFAFATVILPIPSLGITADVVAAQEFDSEGLWVDEPYRVVAFGFLYFGAVGLAELKSRTWSRRRGDQGAE